MDSTADEMKTKSTPASADDDAAKIEDEIERTRASMGDTLEQLHGKLNPGVLKDQALEQFQQAKEAIKADVRSEIEDMKGLLKKEIADAKSELREATIGKVEHMVDNAQQTVVETGNGVLGVMRDNPIPTALIGVGLGWLFVRSRSGRNVTAPARRVVDRVGSRAQSLAYEARDQARHALDEATDEAQSIARRAGEIESRVERSVETMAHDAGTTVAEYAGRAKSNAMTLAHDARDVAVRWEGTFERTLRENPLPVGAIALALGVAAGLAIPSTQIEDEWVGEYRDRAIDEVEHLAEQALGTVESGADKLAQNMKPADGITS